MTHPTLQAPRSLAARLAVMLVLFGSATAWAEAPRVLPEGRLPEDKRLGPLKDLNGYFPFHPCASREAWAKRSEQLRRQMLVALGLWPTPTKTPANAVIHGKVDRPQYTVEKVYLESYPGHFVTGNLYRPKERKGRLPGVLCPHGHWASGRFHDAGAKEIRQQIVGGEERFEIGGRHPIQARCVQLARMGCVVFQYDMVGYADSQQLVHRPGVREKMNTPENWGYFSPQAELRLQNMMGLQTYNSIRTLDWFSELPDVDPKRIAVTGASGGGTQTFILCAIDSRPAVAFPAVMVSTAMQGGCTCENACYLRVGTGNVEIAALISPRPLGMTAADDWTKEIATKGLPELKQHYKMLGVEDLVMARPLVHFGHNYNYVSREVMYHWLNRHLKLGLEEPIVEEDYQPLSKAEMSVWDDEHPRPPSGDDYERSLLKWLTEDSQKQMAALPPHDRQGLARYREIVGGAVDVIIGRGLAEPGAIGAADLQEQDLGEWRLAKFLIRHTAAGEELPAIRLQPKSWNKRAVIWIDKMGKQSLFDAQGMPKPPVRKLLEAGTVVVGVDLFGQGEFTADGKPAPRARLVNNEYAGYTFGYNHPVFSQRVHDVLSTIALLKGGQTPAERVYLVGLAGAGHWVAAARAQAGAAVDRAVIDTAGFRFVQLTAIDDPDFLPGGAKYGDLPGMIALSAPHPLWLAGEGPQPPPVVAAAYKASGQPDNLTVFSGEKPDRQSAAIEWLLRWSSVDDRPVDRQ
jgi:dienelactone hydrolase